MSWRAIAIVVMFAALVTGCATGPSMSELRTSLPAQEQGKGRVYFYRTGIIGSAYQPDVTLNGAVVGKAAPRGAYFRDVPPGTYTVTTSMTNEKVNFVLAAGEQQYIRLSYSFGFNIYPELVETSTGEKEIQDLSYIASQ